MTACERSRLLPLVEELTASVAAGQRLPLLMGPGTGKG
jgi:hypothetical protein